MYSKIIASARMPHTSRTANSLGPVIRVVDDVPEEEDGFSVIENCPIVFETCINIIPKIRLVQAIA